LAGDLAGKGIGFYAWWTIGKLKLGAISYMKTKNREKVSRLRLRVETLLPDFER
jgi:hypothetical protein